MKIEDRDQQPPAIQIGKILDWKMGKRCRRTDSGIYAVMNIKEL